MWKYRETAWERLCTASLRRMCFTCVLTVSSETTSRLAMRAFVSPSASMASTSRSRRVSISRRSRSGMLAGRLRGIRCIAEGSATAGLIELLHAGLGRAHQRKHLVRVPAKALLEHASFERVAQSFGERPQRSAFELGHRRPVRAVVGVRAARRPAPRR